MKDYLNWIAEKFIADNFVDNNNIALWNDICDLILKYPRLLGDKYSPEAYLKERDGN